jgi:hypothetical protein
LLTGSKSELPDPLKTRGARFDLALARAQRRLALAAPIMISARGSFPRPVPTPGTGLCFSGVRVDVKTFGPCRRCRHGAIMSGWNCSGEQLWRASAWSDG